MSSKEFVKCNVIHSPGSLESALSYNSLSNPPPKPRTPFLMHPSIMTITTPHSHYPILRVIPILQKFIIHQTQIRPPSWFRYPRIPTHRLLLKHLPCPRTIPKHESSDIPNKTPQKAQENARDMVQRRQQSPHRRMPINNFRQHKRRPWRIDIDSIAHHTPRIKRMAVIRSRPKFQPYERP